MSALPPKADMCGTTAYVRYGPIDGVIGRRCCGSLKILGAALQADGCSAALLVADRPAGASEDIGFPRVKT